MRDPVAELPLMTRQMFPHGLMCPVCSRLITEGQPFQNVVTGMYEDGSHASRIQCVYCPTDGNV